MDNRKTGIIHENTESPLWADSVQACASDQYGRDVRKAAGATANF